MHSAPRDSSLATLKAALQPPPPAGNGGGQLEQALGPGLRLVVIPLDGLPAGESVDALLTAREARRLAQMHPRRQTSFVGGRLALKLLAGESGLVDWSTPAKAVQTVAADERRPCCTAEVEAPHCSLAHDADVAVAALRPHRSKPGRLGVDVEQYREILERGLRLYTEASERSVVDGYPGGRAAALLRLWTAKEAIAKAFNVGLAEVWRRARLEDCGATSSRLRFADQRLLARHAALEHHLVTLVHCDA